MQMHIRPKHQKLILQCYPPGRGADKQPNPSELSYLLYYASTRRSKLTKVGIFLETKTSSDVYKGRAGDVQVTLDIIKELIEKTHEDLNLFASNVVTILRTIISSNDLALCQHASPVMDVFCKYHDGALFSGDPIYVQHFHQLVEDYTSLAKQPQAGPNISQWKLVGIKALKSIASSNAVSTPTGLSHIHNIIPVLLSTLNVDTDGSTLVELDSKIHPLSRRESRRYSMAPERPALTGDSLIFSTSIEALKHFYDTTSDMVLKAAVVTTLAFIRENSCSQSWASNLIITCAKWVPVQIRFAVVLISVEKLASLALNDLKAQLVLASVISSLLSSSVTMIGLSVIDIQRLICYRQATLLKDVTKDNYRTGNPSVFDLTKKLRDCVVGLASHIYYATQIPDMLSELLFKFQDVTPRPTSLHGTGTNTPIAASSEPINTSQTSYTQSLYLSNLLKTVTSILALTSSRANQGADVSLTISSWDGTQKLLTHIDPDIRVTFANTLVVLLGSDSINLDQIAPFNNSPNFSLTSGPVGRIVGELYSLANFRQPLLTSDYLIIYHISTLLSTNMTVNGSVRSAALAFALQEKAHELVTTNEGNDVPNNDPVFSHAVALATISLAVFFTIGAVLKSESLLSFARDEIIRRKSIGLWHSAIETPLLCEFLADIKQKTERLQKSPYQLPPDVNISETLRYPSKDNILSAFSQFDSIPAVAKAAIVQELPPTEEITTYSSVPASRHSSVETTGGEFNNRNSRFMARARSLKQLNHNTARAIPVFCVQPVASDPADSNKNPERIDLEQNDRVYNNNIASNGTEISLNNVPIDNQTLMGEKSLEAVRTSDENKHNGSLNRSNTDSTARNEKPGTHLEGTPSNAYDLLHSNYTNNSLTVPGMRSDIKSSPSFVDIYRENAPTVKDLKKAASGYKLPYAMSIQSNGLNMAPNGALMTGNHNTVGKGGKTSTSMRNYAGSGGLSYDTRGGYARSISSAFTRGSEVDGSFSDSTSLNGGSGPNQFNQQSLASFHEPFDVTSFLGNLSIDPVQERGRLV